MTPLVHAAGCVLWRRVAAGGTGSGDIEVAVIHRPKHDDWSLPKGKLDPGEDHRHAAVREVLEETGMTCALGPELPKACYRAGDRPKEVRYWAAEATGGAFRPNGEVDELRWLSPPEARALLSYPVDRDLVDAALAAISPGRR
ncbi:NUDIX hydrolase [Streptomyces sp. NPDC006307]|uniref:NUDIX hydrolase n=1 Tax=Streptomyces sp. NPDC006307 TaxID=3156748 RepID=UPI0033A86F2F